MSDNDAAGDIEHTPETARETTAVHREVFPAPTEPLEVAHRIYRDYRRATDDMRTVVAWRSTWMGWNTTHWAELDTAELRSEIYAKLRHVDYMRPIREKGQIIGYEEKPWAPDKRKVANVIEAMQAVGHLSKDVDPPSWIERHDSATTPAAQMVSCTNGLLDLSMRTMVDHTPALFNTVSVPFAYDADAPKPVAWLAFLGSVWGDDVASIALLQEYMGYVLSGRTDMQKMLLLIGPTRSGKGTIARTLTKLVGPGNVGAPTLNSLGANFGLATLIDKPLAVIADARLGNTPSHTVVERLLSITGEDMQTVDRKYRDPWNGKLPIRFVMLSNELPKFRDSSGAIANRMLILQMTRSFLDEEDTDLGDKLAAELPGILLWSLAGLDRLNKTGRFTVPKSAKDATRLMFDLASPASAFVRERCKRGPELWATKDELYDAWKRWAEDNGHGRVAKEVFFRDLLSVATDLKAGQRTIEGKRIRCYNHIEVLPVHLVQDDETAGQGDDDDDQPCAATCAGSGHASHDGHTCTGCGAHCQPGKPLVNGLCTGCTGSSATQLQHKRFVPPSGPGRCDDCHHHIERQGHADGCPQREAS